MNEWINAWMNEWNKWNEMKLNEIKLNETKDKKLWYRNYSMHIKTYKLWLC